MSLLPFVLVLALVSLVPGSSLAQVPDVEQPAGGAERAGTAPLPKCAWHDLAITEQQRVSREVDRVQRALDERSVKGAVLGLALSGALFVAGTLTAAFVKDSEYQSVPALWAIPGAASAGVIASGIVLYLRQRQRHPYKAQRLLLLRQKAQLDFQQQTFTEDGCVDLGAIQRGAATRIVDVDTQLAAIDARARAVSLVGPLVMLGSGAIIAASATVAGIILLVGVADAEDHSEPTNRAPMRAAFGSVPVGAALLVGGGIWLGRRRHERGAIVRSGKPLGLEKRRLDTMLAPQVGPSSLGLSWTGRF